MLTSRDNNFADIDSFLHLSIPVGNFVNPNPEGFEDLVLPSSAGQRTPQQIYISSIETPSTIDLGERVTRTDIHCTPGKFETLPSYKITYPPIVVDALGELYQEYNLAFDPLIKANREWSTDYQHCHTEAGSPINYFVQIDMVGLPDAFLQEAPSMDPAEVNDVVRNSIFEIENSLAAYELLQKIFAPIETYESHFATSFRAGLDNIREFHGNEIILLASTEQKRGLMGQYEFGKEGSAPVPNQEVKIRTGFDRFMGPNEFADYIELNGGNCPGLIYVRSSLPTSALKKPKTRQQVDNPLLSNRELREIIKAQSITLNVDSPSMSFHQIINDTKSYLVSMDMAYPMAQSETDPFQQIFTPGFVKHLKDNKPYANYPTGQRLQKDFVEFLIRAGVDPLSVELGTSLLRLKPMKDSYGAYGHETVNLTESKHRADVRRHMKSRGDYVIQPEKKTPRIVDGSSFMAYGYIDRNFFYMSPGDGKPVFMSGFRTLLPEDSREAKAGRYHGNIETRWAEIRSFRP